MIYEREFFLEKKNGGGGKLITNMNSNLCFLTSFYGKLKHALFLCLWNVYLTMGRLIYMICPLYLVLSVG